jgi:hypothetical protein
MEDGLANGCAGILCIRLANTNRNLGIAETQLNTSDNGLLVFNRERLQGRLIATQVSCVNTLRQGLGY